MIPEPWTVPSLPPGLASRDFDDAAQALRTGQLTGRIIPVPAALNRSRNLSGTYYYHNARRINAALGYPTLAGIPHVPLGPDTGLVLPGVLWLASSPAEGTRPVSCIGPNGYYGSLYAGDLSRELHNFILTEARRGRLIAVPLELARTPGRAAGLRHVNAWLPPKSTEIERLRRWLTTPAAVLGAAYTPKIELHAWLKRLGDYQEELQSLLAGADQAETRVHLCLEETASGKYRGEKFVRVTVLDRTIGLIPAQYRPEAPEIFASVEAGVTSARARIFRYPERIAVQIVLD